VRVETTNAFHQAGRIAGISERFNSVSPFSPINEVLRLDRRVKSA
jgi:hypothetical protein